MNIKQGTLKSAQNDHRKVTRTVNFWINMRIVYGKVLTLNNFFIEKFLLLIKFEKITLLDGTKVSSSNVFWSPTYPRSVPKKSVISIHNEHIFKIDFKNNWFSSRYVNVCKVILQDRFNLSFVPTPFKVSQRAGVILLASKIKKKQKRWISYLFTVYHICKLWKRWFNCNL